MVLEFSELRKSPLLLTMYHEYVDVGDVFFMIWLILGMISLAGFMIKIFSIPTDESSWLDITWITGVFFWLILTLMFLNAWWDS